MTKRTIIFSALWIAFCMPLVLAQSLNDLVAPGTKAVVLGEGYGFSEGPAADAVGNIYFSDGANDVIHFYAHGQAVQVFSESFDANGMMFNHLGELGVCEGAAYQVVAFNTRTKEKRILTGKVNGERVFNEPNDLTFDATGGFYFTDPNYKHRGQETIRKEDVYYVSNTGEVSLVSTICKQPNGIILTPDDKILYVADCAERLIYRYKVDGPGKLSDEKLWIELERGAHPDGMTLDANGNLYIACGRAGVLIYDKEGKKIGTLAGDHGIPYASNCVFGGPNFSILYITAADKFLGIPTKTKGICPRHAEVVP